MDLSPTLVPIPITPPQKPKKMLQPLRKHRKNAQNEDIETGDELELGPSTIPTKRPIDTSPKTQKKKNRGEKPSSTSLLEQCQILLNQAILNEEQGERKSQISTLLNSLSAILNKGTCPTLPSFLGINLPDSSQSSEEKNPELQRLEQEVGVLKGDIKEILSTLKAGQNRENRGENQQSGLKTYAQATAGPTPKSTQKPPQKNAKSTPQPPGASPPKNPTTLKSNYRSRRVILLTKDKTIDFSPLQMRNEINKRFQTLNLTQKTPVLASVQKSRVNQNIILTTTEEFSGEFLLQNEAIWASLFEYTRAILDQQWYRVLVHDLPLRDFNHEYGMQLLKDEIQTFNKGFQVLGLPKWLTSQKSREEKRHGSAIIAFSTREEQEKALKTRLQVAGVSVRTEKLKEIKPTIQCEKCQRFGHFAVGCKNPIKCRICASSHPTSHHECQICNEKGVECLHSELKCANCENPHQANFSGCEVVQAIQNKAKTRASNE